MLLRSSYNKLRSLFPLFLAWVLTAKRPLVEVLLIKICISLQFNVMYLIEFFI